MDPIKINKYNVLYLVLSKSFYLKNDIKIVQVVKRQDENNWQLSLISLNFSPITPGNIVPQKTFKWEQDEIYNKSESSKGSCSLYGHWFCEYFEGASAIFPFHLPYSVYLSSHYSVTIGLLSDHLFIGKQRVVPGWLK